MFIFVKFSSLQYMSLCVWDGRYSFYISPQSEHLSRASLFDVRSLYTLCQFYISYSTAVLT